MVPTGHWLEPDLALSLVAERHWICTQPCFFFALGLSNLGTVINTGTVRGSSRGQAVETGSLSLTKAVPVAESPHVHSKHSLNEHCLAETESSIAFLSGDPFRPPLWA